MRYFLKQKSVNKTIVRNTPTEAGSKKPMKCTQHFWQHQKILKKLVRILVRHEITINVPLFKGTWQRGGFSGVFAEIGSA